MLSEVVHVEFDLLFKECMILQLIPGINNAEIAAGHVLCAVNGMLGLKWLSQWLSSSRCHSQTCSGIFPNFLPVFYFLPETGFHVGSKLRTTCVI